MQNRFIWAAVGLVLVAAALVYWVSAGREPRSSSQDDNFNSAMRLESPSFSQNDKIPAKHTCDGLNLLPPLRIIKAPEDAVSLAIIVDDPDASAGTFTHWTIWNVPPDVVEIEEGSVPVGIQGRTGFGHVGWGGPCPPDREHRYFFKIYALNVMLDLPEGAGVEELEAAMAGHVIDKAGLVGVYERPQ